MFDVELVITNEDVDNETSEEWCLLGCYAVRLL
jgi:hypothetical protein